MSRRSSMDIVPNSYIGGNDPLYSCEPFAVEDAQGRFVDSYATVADALSAHPGATVTADARLLAERIAQGK